MREIVLDTETTGLDPLDGHRLVEIGCIELVNRIPSGQTFHRYFNPGAQHAGGSIRSSRLSEDFLKDKVFFRRGADDLVAFLGDAPLVIHNAAFDLGFLNAEFERAGRPPIGRERLVDTLLIARRKHPGGSNRLDDLCVRYGIDNSRRTKHGALLDAELLAEVYVELIGARQAQLVLGASRGCRAGPGEPIIVRQRPCRWSGASRRGTRGASRVYRHARRKRDLARLRQFGLTGCDAGRGRGGKPLAVESDEIDRIEQQRGKPPLRTAVATISRANGNSSRGHSISTIGCMLSAARFGCGKAPAKPARS
jgi:DNA polymerase-3 subunit epsilon